MEEKTHYLNPWDIEKRSMEIILEEVEKKNIYLPEDKKNIIIRVIHTTADFDYAENLVFGNESSEAVLGSGTVIITDTNMTLSGISKKGLSRLGMKAVCFMAEDHVREKAQKDNTTRAIAAMEYAAGIYPKGIYAVGNAPTALFKIGQMVEENESFRPSLMIAVPVGFVNVTESKEYICDVCKKHGIPYIAAMGRKGGSTVATAICNAIIYEALGVTDPKIRSKTL